MSEKKEKEQLEPIDLMDLLHHFLKALRRLWILVLVLGLACSLLFFIRAKRNFRPQYEAKALFSVGSGYGSSDIFNSSYYDNIAAQQLAEAFPYMLSTDLMRDMMKQQLGVSYINGTITANAVASTNMFTLTVRSSSPEDAYDILWAVIDCYPQAAVYMVDDPQVIIQQEPAMPTSPCNTFSWKVPALKGLIMGLAAGLAITFIVSLMSKTVGTVEQLKALINLPILTVLPQVQLKKRRSEKEQFVMLSTSPELEEPLQGLVLKLHKALDPQGGKIILVTSTLSGEGKTTVATNLALSLVGSGKRVVLVDADLRSQSIAARLSGTPSKHGLIDCLKSPKLSVMDNLVEVPNTTLCYLSGNSASNLRYSIEPKPTRRILTALASEFDYVVMDTAPCAMVADTLLLCSYADCVLYVVKPNHARQAQIFDTINELYDRDVPVAGLVFNNVPISRGQYGYGYKYAYGYRYKYAYGYGSKRKSKKQAEEVPGET